MNLLEKTEQLFHSARKVTMEAAGALYECMEKEAWKESYETQGEFVEALGLSQSSASKLLTVYRRFRIEAPISHAKLAGVDTEKLYLATSIKGTPEEQFAYAETLTRGELKAQRSFEENGIEHECVEIKICKTCGKRLG